MSTATPDPPILTHPRCGHPPQHPLYTLTFSPTTTSSSPTQNSPAPAPKPLCPPCHLREESRILAQYSAALTKTVVRAKKEMWSPDETERACEELYRVYTEEVWRLEEEGEGEEEDGR